MKYSKGWPLMGKAMSNALGWLTQNSKPKTQNYLMGWAVFIGLFLGRTLSLPAQHLAQDSIPTQNGFRKSSLIPIPLVYYTPETGWAGGAAVLYAFRWRGQADRLRPSQLQLGFAYTQRKQLLLYLPFQFFFDQERYQAFGELGYYRYVYQFFGIGNNTLQQNEESYAVDFPRVRLNLMRLVAPHHYLGIRYWWDDYQIKKTAANGILATEYISGNRGSVISGVGALWNVDSRDDIFYPKKGYLIETELFANAKIIGSNFRFSRLSVDANGYFAGRRKKNVLALNAWLVFMQGNPPFQQLAFIGGPKKMRGYFEGRLRDKNLWVLQAEYRLPIYRRLGAAVFSGVGAVAPDVAGLFQQNVHFTYGAGLRFRLSKKDHINLRLDVAANDLGEIAPYLTVKEAF